MFISLDWIFMPSFPWIWLFLVHIFNQSLRLRCCWSHLGGNHHKWCFRLTRLSVGLFWAIVWPFGSFPRGLRATRFRWCLGDPGPHRWPTPTKRPTASTSADVSDEHLKYKPMFFLMLYFENCIVLLTTLWVQKSFQDYQQESQTSRNSSKTGNLMFGSSMQ